MSQGSMEEEKVPLVQNLFPSDEDIHVSESEKPHRDGLMQKLQKVYKDSVGDNKQLQQQRRLQERMGKKDYSVSLIAAISQERLEAA